ncbi:CDP-alcohol phosphatidyltransferase family protein [Clostridium sp. D2Q-14]|uniref:CDP-alcohol phosphatidyltransferase family protein n=1 Tax=Anaeromonas gelatinilytica TaxID=2683194 RepID=UPI00193B344F|nr:CDP-alcohol phosphatidyltransferase family protein [Anaeromonas gelatinilytica]MBS4536501.1 CDP-alcohol phosphatidyltransferase family protein [Anaeromonas gelatinilytica]
MNKYIPNILSILRVICSVLLILLIDNRIGFVCLYLVIGLTDVLDGFIARRFMVESNLGAKLDSVADFVFYIILFFICVNLYSSIITVSYKIAIIVIIFIRLINLLLTKIKYKKFVFVHTIANKVSGVLLYFLPVVILFKQNDIIIWIIFIVVFIAAIEELSITIKYSEVKLNRISIFCK